MQIEALETVFAQLLGANPIVGNLLLLRNVLIRNLCIRFGLTAYKLPASKPSAPRTACTSIARASL